LDGDKLWFPLYRVFPVLLSLRVPSLDLSLSLCPMPGLSKNANALQLMEPHRVPCKLIASFKIEMKIPVKLEVLKLDFMFVWSLPEGF
jgi:hypothetical protein